jgi:hypothetical protein
VRGCWRYELRWYNYAYTLILTQIQHVVGVANNVVHYVMYVVVAWSRHTPYVIIIAVAGHH